MAWSRRHGHLHGMKTCAYPSDLTDEEWAILGPLIAPATQAGHPQVLQLRRIADAVFYLPCSTCRVRAAKWRALPHDFPPWTAVFYHHARWRRQGSLERINAALRERHRVGNGRQAQPTAAVIDIQSVRTTEAGGPRGYDGGKKVSGRKRHILVDTERTLLKARVHPADIHDRSGAPLLLRGEWVAPGQQPPEIPRGFHVRKRRWVVERTFAWVGRNRRMSRDYERLTETGEMLLYAAMARVTLQRLAKRTN
jgi:putative transposase